MTPVAEQVVRIATRSGVAVSEALGERLAAYVGLLAKWDARLNLTGFDRLDPPSDEAVARLLVEPVTASSLIPDGAVAAIDVGSGGGSPAIPLKLMRPSLRFVLVESKARKAAFLREAGRYLELDGFEVVTRRFEDLAGRPEFKSSADLVTVRAVRLDDDFWTATSGVLKPGGHVLLFRTASDTALAPFFKPASSTSIPGTTTVITLATRA